MRKWSVFLMCVLCGGFAWLDARAQDPLAGVIFFQHRQFKIPFKNDFTSASVKQVRLYVSSDQGRSWNLTATAVPEERHFKFSTPQDGFFWFAVQTVDTQDKLAPAGVDDLRANLKVIVDSAAPVVQVQPLPPRNNEIGVSWSVRDDNLDIALPDSMRVEWRVTGAATWIPLSLPLGASQIYWNPLTNAQLEVRVLARDRAGNVGEDKTNVGVQAGGGFVNPLQPDPAPNAFGNLERKYVNNKQISLVYDLKEVGPSGVSCVELWYTLYQGRAWNKLTEYPLEIKNPAEAQQAKRLAFDVEGEGVYGISLVAKSGVGLSSRAPQPGDRPQFWIEVDLTKPQVQLLGVHVGQGVDKGKLAVSWTARDKNLGPNPIRLSYAEDTKGPWTTFAENLANNGKYVWTMPDPLPYQFYVRVEAPDRASNIGEAITPDKIRVDLSQPKAMIREIEPSSK
ncbi:MAG: hypothetical protein EXS16_00870 [Gemmataceae bacterium]|nr:hypothetical protein [Gemmataceae bacterium]